jgi:hypothetical protein
MSNKKLSADKYNTLIFASAILLLGIMFCCFGAWALSYILGAFVIFIGALFIINSIARMRVVFTINGLVGAILVTIGAMIISNNLAGLLLSFIPWIMVSVGTLITADAFLRYFLRRDVTVGMFATEIAIGVLVTLAGLGVMLIKNWANFASVVFGIALIFYSIFLIVTTLIKTK